MEVNIGYAWGQLMRARQTAAEHADADVRARARETIAKWEGVIAGMQGGTIKVGSRTPTSAPSWVTLEVVTGGFATGTLSAGGPIKDYERELAARVGVPPTRVALNLYFLTSSEASQMLASGRYRIELAEEGALLVIAWLRERGEFDRVNALVEALAPWFETLRFYPVPAEHTLEIKDSVRLQDLGTTLEGLDVDRRQPRFETMRESLRVWQPLRARALALFVESIDGEVPRLDGNGVIGGWPGATFPHGWHARVEQLVSDLAEAGEPKTKRAREVSALIEMLSRCAKNPSSVTKAECGKLRRTIACHVAAYGVPGSSAYAAKLAGDAEAVSAPLHSSLRRVLVSRLRTLPLDGGVELQRALASVTPDEAARNGVPTGTELPSYFERKVARSHDGSLDELVDRGVIGSGEVFARVLPQVTSQVRAQTIDDVNVRRLYVALYTAFRRRRGLLLLNYQHQVRFQELPWVAALEETRATDDAATSRARKAVANASSVALRAFPYTIVPNKLVTELYSLTNAAGLKLPFVEELAADIFMGSFTAKFVEAAKVSARLLAGTLYQRYYAIDVDEIARMPVPAEKKPSPELAALCQRRAGPLNAEPRSYVARNGKIIEQAQILTTHNLAVLFDALPLRDQLAPSLRPIAETCFQWSTRRLRLGTSNWHQFLINLKNAAYAWRQMVFYLSFCPELPAFLSWGRSQLERADDSFRRRFEPAMRGLELAAANVSSNESTFVEGGGRVFTGWSTDRHWLAPAAM